MGSLRTLQSDSKAVTMLDFEKPDASVYIFSKRELKFVNVEIPENADGDSVSTSWKIQDDLRKEFGFLPAHESGVTAGNPSTFRFTLAVPTRTVSSLVRKLENMGIAGMKTAVITPVETAFNDGSLGRASIVDLGNSWLIAAYID